MFIIVKQIAWLGYSLARYFGLRAIPMLSIVHGKNLTWLGGRPLAGLGWETVNWNNFFLSPVGRPNQSKNITKIDESVFVAGNHILLPYTQHLQYIFINFTKFYFQGTFKIHVKVDKTHFYRKQWIMYEYYDFSKNNSTCLTIWNIDIW